mmetsp:Transcript_44155/g.84379  ORF Transcript_44155/g.84379 Transcript_44155/m.84379 type:complete len:295 (+) Transcript_44155:42-926(+)
MQQAAADCVGAASPSGGADTAPASKPDEEAKPTRADRVDAIWAALQQKAGGPSISKGAASDAARGGEVGTRVSLASLCKPIQGSKKRKQQVSEADDKSWQRSLAQLGAAGKSTNGGLKEVAKGALATAAATLRLANTSVGSVVAAEGGASELQNRGGGAGKGVVEKQGKLHVTETQSFAGQQITVTRVLAADSKEGKKLCRKKAEGAGATTGIDAVLQQLEKRRKMNVLDKTKMDWGEYKQEQDTDVVEDLEKHKRSGETHLEKKDFLERTDVRQYELERDERLAASSRTRGRI